MRVHMGEMHGCKRRYDKVTLIQGKKHEALVQDEDEVNVLKKKTKADGMGEAGRHHRDRHVTHQRA